MARWQGPGWPGGKDISMSSDQAPAQKFASRNLTTPLGPVGMYHLRCTLVLSSVPFLCGIVLMLLISVFAKLNLYYLESNGLLVDDQVRDAYYSQVQIETMNVAGFLLLQLVVTAIASIIVMRWASAPFTNAARTVQQALDQPDLLRPRSRLLSESPFFDRVVWLFALRVKNGGGAQQKDPSSHFLANLLFLVKFYCTFDILSVVTGSFMYSTIGTVYEKIVALSIQLMKNTSMNAAQHYFAAQQEVLRDATTITTATSLIIYFVIGLKITQYMSTMIWVFARSLEDDRFPLQLRSNDVYHGLAAVLNRGREKIK